MTSDTPNEVAPLCPPESRIYVLIAAILASSMGFIDGSVLSIATPAIRADLGASLADAQWVSNAYLLGLAALLLIGGATGDRFGLRNVFGFGIAMFVAASNVCAIAPTPLFLIISRAIQGCGAALMVPGSLAIIAKAYPRAERGKAIGLWSSFASLTTILGLVLGGLVLSSFGDWAWRLVFAINLPLGGVALALLWLKVPADRPEAGRSLDLVGSALVALGLFLVAFGLSGSEGGAPLISQVVIYCGAGLVTLLAFVVWEARATHPMLPLVLFRQGNFAGAQGLTFTLYFALNAVTFYLPMTLIAGWGVSPATVAIVFLPFGLCLTVLSPVAGRLADRFGPAPLIAGGALVVALACMAFGVLAPLHDVWVGALLPILIMGIGMSAVVSPLSTAVMTSVDDHDTGLASGVNNAVCRVAGLLAIALMGGVAAGVFERALGGAAELPLFFGLPPDEILPADIEALRVAASNAAFLVIAYSMAAVALVSAIIAWFTQERKPRKRVSIS